MAKQIDIEKIKEISKIIRYEEDLEKAEKLIAAETKDLENPADFFSKYYNVYSSSILSTIFSARFYRPLIQAVIKYKLDVNTKVVLGKILEEEPNKPLVSYGTPLMRGIRAHDNPIVRFLLLNGADPLAYRDEQVKCDSFRLARDIYMDLKLVILIKEANDVFRKKTEIAQTEYSNDIHELQLTIDNYFYIYNKHKKFIEDVNNFVKKEMPEIDIELTFDGKYSYKPIIAWHEEQATDNLKFTLKHLVRFFNKFKNKKLLLKNIQLDTICLDSKMLEIATTTFSIYNLIKQHLKYNTLDISEKLPQHLGIRALKEQSLKANNPDIRLLTNFLFEILKSLSFKAINPVKLNSFKDFYVKELRYKKVFYFTDEKIRNRYRLEEHELDSSKLRNIDIYTWKFEALHYLKSKELNNLPDINYLNLFACKLDKLKISSVIDKDYSEESMFELRELLLARLNNSKELPTKYKGYNKAIYSLLELLKIYSQKINLCCTKHKFLKQEFTKLYKLIDQLKAMHRDTELLQLENLAMLQKYLHKMSDNEKAIFKKEIAEELGDVEVLPGNIAKDLLSIANPSLYQYSNKFSLKSESVLLSAIRSKNIAFTRFLFIQTASFDEYKSFIKLHADYLKKQGLYFLVREAAKIVSASKSTGDDFNIAKNYMYLADKHGDFAKQATNPNLSAWHNQEAVKNSKIGIIKMGNLYNKKFAKQKTISMHKVALDITRAEITSSAIATAALLVWDDNKGDKLFTRVIFDILRNLKFHFVVCKEIRDFNKDYIQKSKNHLNDEDSLLKIKFAMLSTLFNQKNHNYGFIATQLKNEGLASIIDKRIWPTYFKELTKHNYFNSTKVADRGYLHNSLYGLTNAFSRRPELPEDLKYLQDMVKRFVGFYKKSTLYQFEMLATLKSYYDELPNDNKAKISKRLNYIVDDNSFKRQLNIRVCTNNENGLFKRISNTLLSYTPFAYFQKNELEEETKVSDTQIGGYSNSNSDLNNNNLRRRLIKK